MGSSRRDRDRKDTKKKTAKVKKPVKKKACYFRSNKITTLDYKDVATLKRFVNEKGKILARRTSGLSARFARLVAVAVKRARHMALLPYCTSR